MTKVQLLPLLSLLLCAVLTMVVACESEKKENLLEQDKMVAILVEIHLAEAIVPNVGFKQIDTARAVFGVVKSDIFKKYKTDSTQFYTTYQYYLDHLEEMDKMYAMVLDSLASREASRDLGRIIDSSDIKLEEKLLNKNNKADSLLPKKEKIELNDTISIEKRLKPKKLQKI